MERDMRQQLFEHYETLSFSYYNSHNSGQMMSKLVSDLFDIAEFVPPRTREPVYLSDQGCRLLYLFVLHQLAACIPLVIIVIIMFVFSMRQNSRMQETFMENRRKSETSTQAFRIRSAESAWYSPLPMKKLKRKSFPKAIMHSCFPRMQTTVAWAVSWVGICSFKA